MALVTSSHGHQILDTEPDTCGCCGRPMPSRSSARGRPRMHCGTDCREFSAALSVLADKLEHLAETATEDAWRRARGLLWALANMRGTRTSAVVRVAVQVGAET